MKSSKLKKVLIVTYYWPPSGGAGVQRWLKFSKYLPEYGWEPVIFTPENPEFDQKDDSLLKEVHPELEVLKFPIWEPYKLFKKLSRTKELKQGQILEAHSNGLFKKLAVWLRGNFFVPDPRIFWVKPASEYLLSILEANEIKHVITTGPPHSIHLIGKRLKCKKPALTWIADFRDPWTRWEILAKMNISGPVWKRHKKLEQSVLKISDAVLTVGPTIAEDFKKLGTRHVQWITNGFDRADLPQHETNRHNDKQFVVSHIGMLNSNRNPKILWQVLEELCHDDEFYHAFELRLTGILSEEVLLSINSFTKLRRKLIATPSVHHSAVFQQYRESSLLILAQTNSTKGASELPGKLFEYLGAQRPILALGRLESDVAKIIDETCAGQLFTYTDRSGLAQFVREEFKSWKAGMTNRDYKNTAQFERKKLTKKLADWLDTF